MEGSGLFGGGSFMVNTLQILDEPLKELYGIDKTKAAELLDAPGTLEATKSIRELLEKSTLTAWHGNKTTTVKE